MRWSRVLTAHRVCMTLRVPLMASDLILIPVQPSPYDVWAAKDIVDMIRKATVYKPGLNPL